MVQKRDVVKCIIFSILTCGIYGIIWFINLTNDVGTLSGDSEFTGGKYFLLTIVTCGIFGFVWAYKLGKNLKTIADKNGQTGEDHSILYLVLNLLGLGIVVYCLAQSEVNKYAVTTPAV